MTDRYRVKYQSSELMNQITMMHPNPKSMIAVLHVLNHLRLSFPSLGRHWVNHLIHRQNYLEN